MDAKRNPFVTRLAFSLLLGLLVLLAVLGLLGRAFGEGESRVAKRAPDFSLKDTDGRVVKIADFAGKPLIVCFVVTWDEPSLKQIKILSELLKEHEDKELVILGVAIEQEGKQSAKAYVNREHPSFPFLIATYEVIQAFGGLTGVPTTFVIDKDHNAIDRHVGITGKKILEADLKPAAKP
jgi:peroxiredoxin